MSSILGWQGDWEGRKSTEWTGPIRSLRKKIPAFTQNIFQIGMGINKYKDLIVREPFPDVAVDLGIGHIEDEFGYIEAATRDRIPIESVRNDYRSRLFRGRKQGYKLVGHHELLDDVLMALIEHPSLRKIPDVESLKATMYLSIYGARMHIGFLVPCYKRDPYILSVTCRNSVDKKFALTINLSLYNGGAIKGNAYTPFDGFHHIHTQELKDGAIGVFMHNALNNFLYGTWQTDTIDIDNFEATIRKNLTDKERKQVLDMLDYKKQKQVNIQHFLEILAMLFQEGREIFRHQERKLTKLAILTRELHELADGKV